MLMDRGKLLLGFSTDFLVCSASFFEDAEWVERIVRGDFRAIN